MEVIIMTMMEKSLYKCSKCKDTGWILKTGVNGAPVAKSCECRKRNLSVNQWQNSGLNAENSRLTFKNFIEWNESSRTAKTAAIAYFKNFDVIRHERHNSIIFCGQPGSGKTHLAVALAINFMKKNKRVIYMPYRTIITEMKQNILDFNYYKKIISKYETCEILLIDDLFKGKISESDLNIIFEIINYRYVNYLPMIINSEFLIDRLLAFDEAIGSRIYEMCKEFVIEMEKNKGNNFRLR